MRWSIKDNAVVHLTRVMWCYAAGYRGWVLLYGTLSFLAMGVGLCLPLVVGELMNAAQHLTGAALTSQTLWSLVQYVALGFLFWSLHGPSRVMEMRTAFLVKQAYQTELFNSVTSLPMKWQKARHSGETIDQLARATQALGEFSETGFEMIHLLTRFVGAVALLSWFMPSAGLVIAVVTLMVMATVIAFDRTLIAQYRVLNKGFNEVAATVQDYLTNVATIISLRLEQRMGREISERMMKIYPLVRRNSVTNELKWFTTSRFVDLTRAGVLLAYVISAAREGHVIEIGALYALSEYLNAIGDTFFQLTWKYGDLVVKSTRVRATEHISAACEADAGASEVRAAKAARLPADWRRIELRDVFFSRPASVNEDGSIKTDDEPVSIEVDSLLLERGKAYAFVGESGSGKSTVLHLLRGLEKAQRSVMICDGVVQAHGLAHLAHATTLVPQEPEIFSDTIRFNITIGVEASDREVSEVIRSARFEKVLRRLPKGLATKIGERGVDLSGGQRQRLALARGMFFAENSASDLVLFDESTSSIDSINERLIFEALLERYADRCMISATHRFHLLRFFDEVLVFAGGRIVERGTVSELLAVGGEFYRLWRSSAEESEKESDEEDEQLEKVFA